MENDYEGKQISLEEAEMQAEQARKAGRFVMVSAGSKARLSFTGNIYERHATGGNGSDAWESDKLDFELEETANGSGRRLFSLAKGNRAVPELIRQLKAGNMALTIIRDKNNRYVVKA
jgi:hypothetical protein